MNISTEDSISNQDDFEPIHLFDTDLKLKHLGYGEWVEEPDQYGFVHKGLKCFIRRQFFYEDEQGQGGYLCGYVELPETFDRELIDDLEVHGGITYRNKLENKENFWVGFDCAHCDDLVPSIEIFKKNNYKNDRRFFPTFATLVYRNISYVENQCRSLADQIQERANVKI